MKPYLLNERSGNARTRSLAVFRAADSPYQHALEELRALEFAREQALLEARRAGLSPTAIAAATGLGPDEVRRMLARAVDD